MKKNHTFWLELGNCYTKLGKFEEAIEAFIQAIELAPKKAEGYLACAKCYMLTEDFEQAIKTCDVGLNFAQKHKAESWAKGLHARLVLGKQQIDELYAESQYGTFTS